ncbi:TetR/AcrR family transcriptional regulator C-terminal domain-containing protein [Catenulispora yoronensis]|uniref:TetR/AcrR family transcriptional regulator C-terminal domain-containing protein n=1 Tax=Catenulispora yoronensis TaxID=450799 RepID=A0ABP5FJH4_9ACTN
MSRATTLTADQIVRAAVALLDEEGLDGLNMRALGKRLDAAATAVYWHIKTKDELVRLAADAVWQEAELTAVGGGGGDEGEGWRAAATASAQSLWGVVGRHPWLSPAYGAYVIYGPGKARHDDNELAIYEAAGFGAREAWSAAATVLTYVMGSGLLPALQAGLARRFTEGGKAAADAYEAMADDALEVAKQFPRLRARIDAEAAEWSAPAGSGFDFGLNAILDGFEVALARGRGGGPGQG